MLLSRPALSAHTRSLALKHTWHSYKEGALSVGESSCVDRCAAKYWQVVAIVGQLIGSGGK